MRSSQWTGAMMVLAIGAAGAAQAQAQDHPVFLPTRDVAVTYSLAGGPGGGQTTHLYYAAGPRQLRIDTPGNAGYVVLDQSAQRRTMVMNDQRQFVSVPLEPGAAEGFVLNSSMTYTRTGRDRVAGIACTEWRVTSEQADGTACVTEDGVLLRGTGRQKDGSGETSLTAVDVRYGPQSPDLFTPPPGFRQMDPSQMQGPPGGGSGQGPDGTTGEGGPPPGYGGPPGPPPGPPPGQ